MLTMNLNTDVDLCNETTRTLIDFIYANNSEPPDLPEAKIVKFDNADLSRYANITVTYCSNS